MTKRDIVEITVRILGLGLIGVAITNLWRIFYFTMADPAPLRDANGNLSYFIQVEGFSPGHPQLLAMSFHVGVCMAFGLLFACCAPWITRVVLRCDLTRVCS